jgi:hypothetical protein
MYGTVKGPCDQWAKPGIEWGGAKYVRQVLKRFLLVCTVDLLERKILCKKSKQCTRRGLGKKPKRLVSRITRLKIIVLSSTFNFVYTCMKFLYHKD